MIDFDTIKFRASRIGDLMTSGRSKNEPWGKTALAYLDEVYIGKKHGRYKDVRTKYMAKGIQAEEDSITLLSTVHKTIYTKNTENLANDFITGTPDIIVSNAVHDVKSSWDIFTFYPIKRNGIDKDYFYQLQSYMWLTGLEKAQLHYCLVDTPEDIIMGELRKLQWSGIEPETKAFTEAEEAIRREMTFSDINKNERVETYKIDRDEDVIKAIEARVVEARQLMQGMYG